MCSLNTLLFLWLPLQENLQLYVQKVFSSITQSSSSCPTLMCDVFRSLRHLASRRFPGAAQRQTDKDKQTETQTVYLFACLSVCSVKPSAGLME